MRNVRYLLDRRLWQAKNAAGEDYTPAYIPALCAYMGVTALPCTPSDIAELGEEEVLVIGSAELSEMPTHVGALILLGSEIGREPPMVARTPTVQGRITDAHGHQLPLFVPVQDTVGGEVLLWADTPAGRKPALVKRGDNVWDFRFDVAATIWYSGDGFPKNEPQNGFFIGRSPDTRPFPPEISVSLPYNDALLAILEEILREAGVPAIHRLPPTEDLEIPDFALHVSGDDEHTSWELDQSAATVMHGLGLPYHLNAMPLDGDFVLDEEKIATLAKLDCEVALHTNYWDYPYTAEEQARQCRLFEEQLGYTTVTNTNHCFIQAGSNTERLRWLESCGVRGDNCKIGAVDPADINAFNICDYAFGTAFPRFTCDDAAHGNRRIGTVEVPVNYYEPRLNEGIYNHPERLTDYVDNAAAHGRIIQLFIHPHYLAGDHPHVAWTLAAVELVRRHWEERGLRPLLTSTDRVVRFWHARAKATVQAKGNIVTVSASCPVILRWPHAVEQMCLDGQPVKVTQKPTADGTAYLLAIPSGEHIITTGQ